MKLSEVDKGFYEKIKETCVNATLGGDPEFFITDEKDAVINADRFLPSKNDPLMVGDVNGETKSKVFFDGIQAELAPNYNRCREYFAYNIRECLRVVVGRIPENFRFTMRPSARIKKSIIEGADPEARIFGCEPDFNAYTCGINTAEMDASKHPYRYAGGHMHFGVSSTYISEESSEYQLARTEQGHLRIIKFIDMMVTLPTLMFDCNEDATRRRKKYGKAGCFRPTPYGIEYRSTSCWWLKSPITVSLVYGLGRLAWTIAVAGLDNDLREKTGLDDETVRGIIDETDLDQMSKKWKKLRAYIAVSSFPSSNPLHIGAIQRSILRHQDYSPLSEKIGPKISKRHPVLSLAAFEYMVKNGIDTMINSDVRKEWSLGRNDNFCSSTGFMTKSNMVLSNNEDFQKFQRSLVKELGI